MMSHPQLSLPTLARAWRQIKDFAGYETDATYLWPRWLVLRAVGLVFVVVFSGIIDESAALIGPHGLAPLSGLIAQLKDADPSALVAFLKAPTLFWFNSAPGLIAALQWGGLLAALCVVLNLWPRMALFVCWLCLLSYVNGWVIYSDMQVDYLLLEVTLLCLPFAPAGFRPGLGAQSPPRRIALFMMRWMLFRVMFETGLSKLINADPRWINLTAMDDLYRTAPCPTYLGYLVHQLPHAWHVGEIALTFAAELGAPLLAMLGGRRGRWLALGCWTVFQAGIQLTCNFGWLNTASIALGLLLLDDQMLATAADRLRLGNLARIFTATATRQTRPVIAPWPRHALRVALWTHFTLSVIVFVDSLRLPSTAVINPVTQPLKTLCLGFGSVNAFALFAWLDPYHSLVEFAGSNDGGQTWRSYDFRYFPQHEDRISPFIAPRFPRFEATLQIEVSTRDKPAELYSAVATQLLLRNSEVMRLFERDPFPDRPPQMIRTARYRMYFTDFATYRSKGLFWERDYLGEYLPMKFLDATGQVAEATTPLDQVRVKAACGNPTAQSHLGFLYVSGEEGVEKDVAEAVKWFRLAAGQGHARAQLNLALIHAMGDGVPKDGGEAAKWFRLAGLQGLAEAQGRLGLLYYAGDGVPRDPVEALAWLTLAADAGDATAAKNRDLVARQLGSLRAYAAEQRARALRAEIKTGK
jgi:TPR repeat protein